MLKWSARQHFIHYSYFFFRALSEKKTFLKGIITSLLVFCVVLNKLFNGCLNL